MPMHSKKQAQIGALLFDKALIDVPVKYSNYNNVFSTENAVELLENTRINKYVIKLEESKQPLFRPIYSLGSVELETLKTYIKTNLAISFIRLSKFSTGAFILFDRKLDRSFCLCVDYQGFNNIIIKNRYLSPLIGELLDCLSRAKRFT